MHLKRLGMLLIIGAVSALTAAQTITVRNPLKIDRQPEVTEVSLRDVLMRLHITAAQADALVTYDQKDVRIPLQLYASKPDDPVDQVLLLVQLHAKEKTTIRFGVDPNATPLPARVFGREAPERKDDFAWENELVTYRVYGPALQAAGEITSGIDVWSKRVPNFVIDSFYKRDLEGIRTHNPELSYHKDNGQGLDSYYVGPTRGCGGTAVLAHGQLFASKNYTSMRVLAGGPLRFAFEVSYAPWSADGVTVSEMKRVVLDAGSHLNQITSTYTFRGAQKLELVAGIALHEGAEVSFPIENKIAAAWDTPQDPTAGRIAAGLIAAPEENASTLKAAWHAMLIFRRSSGVPFTYYAGAAWSKADIPDMSSWNEYLNIRMEMVEHPLELHWQ